MSTTTTTTPLDAGALPVADGVARVHEVLDRVDTSVTGVVTARDVASADRAIARLEALKLTLVAAADRQDAGAQAGMSGTSAWLASTTRSWGGKAAADVVLATALEDSLPVTKEALAAGQVSTAHASVIAGTTSRLPETVTDEERIRIELALVAQAKRLDPARLRRAARRALEAVERSAAEVREHEDRELRSEEARAEARIRLTMHDNKDGTVTGHFTVPALAGAILRKTIQQMTSPRRWKAPARAEGSGCPDGVAGMSAPAPAFSGAEPPRGMPPTAGTRATHSGTSDGGSWRDIDWAARHGEAFVELLEHLPTDRLTGKVAATVVVTIDHDRLREGLGAAHLDTDHDLSASETRRLACSAGLLPAVLGGSSLPLDLGRANRFFSEAQRVALATTYDECAAEGCDRPYAWSELHHQDPWARGGFTDLHLAIPLCRFHHRRAHDRAWTHEIRTDGAGRKAITFLRR